MKKHNFSAGPAILPAKVIRQASEAALEFNGMGLSLLEISHRSKEFVAVLDEAVALVRELLGLNDDWAVLFLTGGASSQFFMTAMNLLDEGDKAAYVDTGAWSSKAIKEARLFGRVEVIASSKDRNYSYIPKGFEVPADARYLHLTSNNTIFGTQYQNFPDSPVPIVCDMSSDIFSRPIDIEPFGLIYAGAQKNLGPAGTTLVLVRKDLLGKVQRTLPTMLDYQTHIAKNSSFNTPPVFPIYVCMLTLRWLKELGGLPAIAQHNEQKARLLYEEIDQNPCFRGTAEREDRSRMNATFVLAEGYESLEGKFLDSCRDAGIVGIKGHRSVGGFRASIYNAMPLESVQVLVQVMQEFAQVLA
ncbi:MAG: 3-phosphoserine/phosphohydroxythreonine transaminase [Bacteroidetes bacterium]|nr:MAG: 3-phosphoserine/phosphohydroxythreonine transaminase [Bacteroidota bacterium]